MIILPTARTVVPAPVPPPVSTPVPVPATTVAATYVPAVPATSAPAVATTSATAAPLPVPAASLTLPHISADLQGWHLSAIQPGVVPPGALQPTAASANLIPRVTLTDLAHSTMSQPNVSTQVPQVPQVQIDADSSDSSDNDGRPIHNYTPSAPNYAYVNPMFITQCGPNLSHVPSKIQRKIQMNHYVDLAKLFRPDNPYERESVFTIKKNGNLKIVSQPKNSDIYTFSRFLDCFIVYMAIRGQSHPQEYPGMLKYIETVKGLFAQQCDGILYDRRFRMMRADNPNVPWSCYMAELVVRKPQQLPYEPPKQNFHNAGYQNQQTATAPKQSGKFCHFFNSGKCVRPACKYPHVCSICFDKTHTKKSCPKKTNG